MSVSTAEAGFTLTLAEPITAHGEVLNAITLRKPKPADALGRAARHCRLQRIGVGGGGFFLEQGFRELGELVARVYDLAWVWRTDPEVMFDRPLDVLVECHDHTQRILSEMNRNG